jgi:hypothetical protein
MTEIMKNKADMPVITGRLTPKSNNKLSVIIFNFFTAMSLLYRVLLTMMGREVGYETSKRKLHIWACNPPTGPN